MFRANLGVFALFVAVTAMASSRKRPVSGTTACFGSDDYSSSEISWLKTITQSTNAVDSAWRVQVQLPTVDDTAVVAVSDSTLCAEGLAAHNAAAQYPDSDLADTLSQKVYLIRVGTLYVAANPHFASGEWVMQYLFNSTFTLKSSFMH
ncbi:MAG TPA: hypothetical protein VIJ16_03040 [Gemmatimonadaceae bacterium]